VRTFDSCRGHLSGHGLASLGFIPLELIESVRAAHVGGLVYGKRAAIFPRSPSYEIVDTDG
jgi:hypothetical protein